MPQATPDLLLLQQRGHFKMLAEGLSGIPVHVTQTQHHMWSPAPWQRRESLVPRTRIDAVWPGRLGRSQFTRLPLPRRLLRSLLQPGSDLRGKEESSPAVPPA